MVAICILKTDFDKVKKSMIILIKFLFFLYTQFLCEKLCIFSVPHEIRKGYGSMTHGAYGTHRTSGTHRTYEAYGTSGTN